MAQRPDGVIREDSEGDAGQGPEGGGRDHMQGPKGAWL